ncbi:MAG: LamG domain-containing protein, partial [Gammaproteobacteria bacterium]|nr:LamG domain-containing protein [Gammaproteobacteria bacterium]
MIPIAAYADRLSVRPGETIGFHVANANGAPLRTRLVRVICGDANPAGPGICTEPVAAEVTSLREAEPQDVPRGSYAVIDGVGDCLQASFTFTCLISPTCFNGNQQAIAARQNLTIGDGFALLLDALGRLRGEIGDGHGSYHHAVIPDALMEGRWYRVWMIFDAKSLTLSIGYRQMSRDSLESAAGTESQKLDAGATPRSEDPLLFAAANYSAPTAYFNGRIERPLLYDHAFQPDDIDSAVSAETVDDAFAQWIFSRDISSERILDVGPNALHGRLVNTPARGMTGCNWSGREMCWRHAPEEYGATHFHEDDIDDCHWPLVYQWKVPSGTRSALYALIIEGGDAEENVPFHVVPARGTRTADIAVLASTFTYTVYGNHARSHQWGSDPDWTKAWLDQVGNWGCYAHHPGAHHEYGWSTYDRHVDGSGISIASWHRPMLNVRLGFLTFPFSDTYASGLRHLPADTHLYAWLEANGYRYDIVTDWELHHEGADLLRDYRVLCTGSHPEYHTRETLDALTAYRDSGGRFCYLGGNGFYWKVALSPDRDGLIEIRRGEGGIRAWAAEPGEYYNQFDGEYGGLWRRNGRPPQHLSGVGFTAQGAFVGSYYRKRDACEDERVAWIFEDVEGEVIGNHGLSGHGAAGYELDRADKRLGTPEHA